jgi:hypothetical protein
MAGKRLKIVATSKLKKDTYSIEFNDGILLNIVLKEGDSAGKLGPMCSLGLDSYFTQKGYFPKGQNLRRRLILGADTIKKRMNRYKSAPVEPPAA